MAENGTPSGFGAILSGFDPVQKVLLFVGFAVFCFGVPNGFHLSNEVLIAGVGLMAAGIAGYYWANGRYDDLWMNDVHSGGGWRPARLTLAIVFFCRCRRMRWVNRVLRAIPIYQSVFFARFRARAFFAFASALSNPPFETVSTILRALLRRSPGVSPGTCGAGWGFIPKPRVLPKSAKCRCVARSLGPRLPQGKHGLFGNRRPAHR